MGVSWFEAEAYCNWLSIQELPINAPDGYIVRLPTDEEWERAARGTKGWRFPWGNKPDSTKTHTAEGHPENKYGFGTMAVCTYRRGVSPVGAWDMSGNVDEWNATWWDEKKEKRVLRGGSWGYDLKDVRCAFRYRTIPDDGSHRIGFRVVVSCDVNEGSEVSL